MKSSVVRTVSDNVIRSLVQGVATKSVDLSCQFQYLSGDATIRGVTDLLKNSSDRFIKEEEFIAKVNNRIEKIKNQNNTPIAGNFFKKILGVFSGINMAISMPKYKKIMPAHQTALEKALFKDKPGFQKEYFTLIDLLNLGIPKGSKLSDEKKVKIRTEIFDSYVNSIVKIVKENLQN